MTQTKQGEGRTHKKHISYMASWEQIYSRGYGGTADDKQVRISTRALIDYT